MTQRQPRERDDKHLAFIRLKPCCVCGHPAPSDAAHIRMADPEIGKRSTGAGEKPSDRWTVPLCRPVFGQKLGCHRIQHSMNEAEFWRRHGINPFSIAEAFWTASRGADRAERLRAPKPRKIKLRARTAPKRQIKSNPVIASRGFDQTRKRKFNGQVERRA